MIDQRVPGTPGRRLLRGAAGVVRLLAPATPVAGAYGIGVPSILAPYTGNNTLAPAGSTLLAAAMFQPPRARVRRAVDRRFNRARVDAQRAIDGFGAHLRDSLDLGERNGRLVAAAGETVQPRAAGLWIRGAGR